MKNIVDMSEAYVYLPMRTYNELVNGHERKMEEVIKRDGEINRKEMELMSHKSEVKFVKVVLTKYKHEYGHHSHKEEINWYTNDNILKIILDKEENRIKEIKDKLASMSVHEFRVWKEEYNMIKESMS